MTALHGAEWCWRRGLHRWAGGVRCLECGAYRTIAEAEEADDIRTAALDEQRAEWEAAGGMSDSEWDAQRHEAER